MAYRIVDGAESIQGTPAWLAFRQRGLGASDAPAVMGRSKWNTPYRLYRQKIGLDPGQRMNPAIVRGIKLEPKARAAYERYTGNLMVPVVLESIEHPLLRASLDGLSIDKIALEVKCPGEEAHLFALKGLVPEWYVDQVQQQLLVSGAKELHYWSFDGDNGVLVKVLPDLDRQKEIVAKSLLFWEKVQAKVWETDEWAAAAAYWRITNDAYEEAKERVESAKKTLASLMAKDETKREGAGVIVNISDRRGNFDYPRFLDSRGIIITPQEQIDFRKAGSTSVRVTEAVNADEIDPTAALQLPPQVPGPALGDPIFDDEFVLEA